jgi:hypothetical protein
VGPRLYSSPLLRMRGGRAIYTLSASGGDGPRQDAHADDGRKAAADGGQVAPGC